jgi:uncharacterized protein YbjQ (UPF0145 family)
MKKLILAVVLVILTTSAYARDGFEEYSIANLLESPKAKETLLDVPLYFADQKYQSVAYTYGEISTNKKINALMKSDTEACESVMLDALKELQERAELEGMDAVVNIKSNYESHSFVSETEYECSTGVVLVNVALKGTLVQFN